ncbi:MAG: crossover junction endodeoxyribonuclease RuvC, partial [Burkholderiaceae bacterium]
MRLIGIDPGLRRTGFGVVEIVSRQKAIYLGSGVIRPPTDRPEPERLGLLYAGM